MGGAATGKARLLTIEILTEGTTTYAFQFIMPAYVHTMGFGGVIRGSYYATNAPIKNLLPCGTQMQCQMVALCNVCTRHWSFNQSINQFLGWPK